MLCKRILKENCTVYMIDSKDQKLDLENCSAIQKYERNNSVKVISMINEFFSKKDSGFKDIINNIEYMVDEYNIDYFVFGEGATSNNLYSPIIYNINNRKSKIDCILKVFYRENEGLNLMISFNEGSSGSIPGYDFYLHFKCNDYFKVRHLIEDYFKLDEDLEGEVKLLDDLYNKIKRARVNYYN